MARTTIRVAFLGCIVLFIAASDALAQRRPDWAGMRNTMVDQEVASVGVDNPRVLDAVRNTPRHEFVPAAHRLQSYLDMALPIGEGQTISPPFVVAYMTQSLDPQPTDNVLEIGTGSGYQAAVLSPLVKSVYSIEIVPQLAATAAKTLKQQGYQNVFTKQGDGFLGWQEHAPFDKIIVTCSPENVPKPLVDQLREGGRMIVPLGQRYQQTLYLFKKQDGKLEREALLPTLFVPMTGAAESQRRVKPDPTHPSVYNGTFEEIVGDPPAIIGWHYQRQLSLLQGEGGPGGQFARFINAQPGRSAQALQGMGLDGREVHYVELSRWVRAKDVKAGQQGEQVAHMILNLYDANRGTIDVAPPLALGPWTGTFDWKKVSKQFRIPAGVREAIIGVGLFGATGELSVDDVQLTPVQKPAS